MFLQFLNRKLIAHGTRINCTLLPESTFFEDISGQLVYTLFNKHQRRKRSHGKRHYNKKAPQPESSIDALITLIDMIDQPEGVHKIETHLFSMSLPQLSSLQEIALESTNTDFSSAVYRVTSIILDISHYRLFKPVKSDVPAEQPKHFIKN